MLIRCTFHLVLFFLSVVAADKAVVVETNVGKIQGAETTAKNGRKFISFTGIPYAKPPVGPLRFAKPEPHPPLGMLNATLISIH